MPCGLAHLAGWAAKLAGATCRLAALLQLASHLRDGWAQPISADTFTGAIRLADYLIEHARAVFDLMGKATDLEPALRLLEEHGYLRRVDPEPSVDEGELACHVIQRKRPQPLPAMQECPAASARERPAYAPRRSIRPPTDPWLLTLGERRP